MKTFKVTFFDKTGIVSIITFHNVTNQALFSEMLAVNIVTLELAPVVSCDADGENMTEATNHFLKDDIANIDPEYAKNWYDSL